MTVEMTINMFSPNYTYTNGCLVNIEYFTPNAPIFDHTNVILTIKFINLWCSYYVMNDKGVNTL